MSEQTGYFNPGAAGSSYIMAAAPAGNPVYSEQQSAQAAATRQAQQAVQTTHFTWIEQTENEGVGSFTIMFDVAFTAEPTIAHGISIAELNETRSTTSAQETYQNIANDPASTAAQIAAARTAYDQALQVGVDPAEIPMSNVLVKRWIRDAQSNYVGAECLVVVRTVMAVKLCDDTDTETAP